MNTPPFLERCQAYRAMMEEFLERWEHRALGETESDSPRPRLHIPKLAGLRRPFPGMFFHLAPELFLQQGGCTEFACPEDRFSLRAGEVALIPRGVPHGERALDGAGGDALGEDVGMDFADETRRRFRGLVFCFHGNELMLIITQSSPEGSPMSAFCDTFEGPEVAQTVRYLDDAGAIPNPATPASNPSSEARRRALVFAAICAVHDLLAPGRLTRRALTHEHPKVRHCHELIRAHLPDPALSVESLARQLGCTPDHLSRCFRAETGMPVLAYVREQRLERAKGLLRDPKLNISEIAWACGFGSLNYFVRVFRQAVGQPPRQFQRAMGRR